MLKNFTLNAVLFSLCLALERISRLQILCSIRYPSRLIIFLLCSFWCVDWLDAHCWAMAKRIDPRSIRFALIITKTRADFVKPSELVHFNAERWINNTFNSFFLPVFKCPRKTKRRKWISTTCQVRLDWNAVLVQDFMNFRSLGSAPCRAVQMTAASVGASLNLKLLNLMAGDHMKPEFLAVS